MPVKIVQIGEMAERLNAAHSKCVVPKGTGGSNPPLSAMYHLFHSGTWHATELRGVKCAHRMNQKMRTQKGAGKIVSRAFGVNSEATSAIRGFVPYWGGAQSDRREC